MYSYRTVRCQTQFMVHNYLKNDNKVWNVFPNMSLQCSFATNRRLIPQNTGFVCAKVKNFRELCLLVFGESRGKERTGGEEERERRGGGERRGGERRGREEGREMRSGEEGRRGWRGRRGEELEFGWRR